MSSFDEKRAQLTAKRMALVAELETCKNLYQKQLDSAKNSGTDMLKAKQESILQLHNLCMRLTAALVKVEDELNALD